MLQGIQKRQAGHAARQIRRQVEAGQLPGERLEDILTALWETKGKNVFEVFGFLEAVKIVKGHRIDLGLVSCQLVTQAFTNYLVDSMQNSTTYPMDVFKYHGSGTGTTAEANTQTALVTEVETRATGTTIEGTTANIYKSVATQAYTDTRSITEHGLFSASTGGTLLDRSLLTAIPVEALDEIEWTYQLTCNAES